MPESKSSPRRIRAKERQKQALELRLAGVTFEAIAEAVGFRSKQAAHDSVTRALRGLPEAAAKDLRELDLKRLDAMYQRIWPFVIAPTVKMMPSPSGPQMLVWDEARFLAVDRCLRILAQRARLLGLDAVKRLELTGAEGGPIELAAVTLAAKLQRIVDGDADILALPAGIENGAEPT